jgi:hypothetical protein
VSRVRAERAAAGGVVVDSPDPWTAAVTDALTPARSHSGRQRSTTRLFKGSA